MTMTDEYIRRQDAIDAFNRIKNTLKNPETAHYDTLMFYEIEDVLEDVEPADVVSKADLKALLEETEKELVKGTDEMSIARCFIVSIMEIVKCKIMQMGEGKE